MRLYIGNLNYDTTEDDLQAHFAVYGDVSDVIIITDRETGQPRGFGFVTIDDDRDAEDAIRDLNGASLDGRALRVTEARERQRASHRRSGRGGDRGRSSW